jgi:hypothetical protein
MASREFLGELGYEISCRGQSIRLAIQPSQIAKNSLLAIAKSDCRKMVASDTTHRMSNSRPRTAYGGPNGPRRPASIAPCHPITSSLERAARPVCVCLVLARSRNGEYLSAIRYHLGSRLSRDALNAGYTYLEVRCLGCNTHQTVALDLVRRPKATPIHELERYMRCKDCSQVRGYPHKRSHLVALRQRKISANDPPSIWWPGRDS